MNLPLRRILENQRVILSALLDEDRDCMASDEVVTARQTRRMNNLVEAINETEALLDKEY